MLGHTHTKPDEEELMKRKRRGDEDNGLSIPCAIDRPCHQYVLGVAPLGNTSLTAGASSPASWNLMQISVDPENGGRQSGVKEGLWVEPAASGWRKAESAASGQSGRQDQVGG